jgi:hypothetical protein
MSSCVHDKPVTGRVVQAYDALCVHRMEAVMYVGMRLLLVIVLFTASLAIAGDKQKPVLPPYVLKARTVAVLIDPDAGTSVKSPLANKTAQEDVEKALMKWGRFTPVMDTQTADLVIVVRKGSGKIVQPTIGGMPTNDRPVVVQPTDNGIRLGGQKGRQPGSTQPAPQDTNPHPQTEVGFSEDMFVVYEGRVDAALDRPPAWRYMSKDALHSPNVPAVAEFRKAIEETEKQQKNKP